jgi:hypothetical protein
MRRMTLAFLVALPACAGRTPAAGAGGGAGAPGGGGGSVLAQRDLVKVECEAGPGRGGWNPYDEKRELLGDNGAFTDSCDANGNLVSHQCEEIEERCPPKPGPQEPVKHMEAPCWRRSGRVASSTVDCDGRCDGGTCRTRCPKEGDQLVIVSVGPGGRVVFASAADPRHFACTLSWDDKRDKYDCGSAKTGDQFEVKGLGLSTTMCTGGTWGAVGSGRCSYTDCRFVYDE